MSRWMIRMSLAVALLVGAAAPAVVSADDPCGCQALGTTCCGVCTDYGGGVMSCAGCCI